MNTFYDFICQLGYEPKSEIIPNKFIRLGRKNSASAKLFANGLGGYLHDWRTGEKHFWFAEDNKSITHQERIERQIEIGRLKTAEEERVQKVHKEVAIQAEILFKGASNASESHPYLVKKKVKPYDICQQVNNLLVPVCSVQGDFQSIQFINGSGDKWFLRGGKTKGGCHFIGLLKMDSPVYIAEGYATAVSVHEDTQCLSIVAFNAKNLVPVAMDLRRHLPDIEIVIAGDYDQIGRQCAEQASKAVNGSTSFPPFTESQKGTDWNDYFMGVTP